MILVVGRFSVEPERRAEFLTFARALIESERQAEGCLAFDVFEDVTAPNVFLMLEQWDSLAAWEHHGDSPASEASDARLDSFLTVDARFDTYEF